MKVIVSKDDLVEFDNGLKLYSEHSQDCCEHNYLDFEQLHIGREFPNMDATAFVKAIKIKEDGFIVKDSVKVPAWVQARSDQNGYYSSGVDLVVDDGKIVLRPKRSGDTYGELFDGKQSGEY